MADVTEVIHKITYEVNNDALENATKAIQRQITELDKLNKTLNSYEKQLAAISANESKQLNTLTRKIDALNKEILKKSAETEGALKQIFNGVLKGMDIEDNLKDAVGKYIGGVRKNFGELQRSGEMLQSALNTVWTSTSTNAAAGAVKTGNALKNLGKSLTSVTGLADIGIVALASLTNELLNMENPLGLITGKTGALNAINQQAAADIALVTADITIMKERFLDANASVETKTEVMNELNSKYGDTIGTMNSLNEAEDFFINKSGDFVKAMTLRAKMQAGYNILAAEQQKLLEAESRTPEENIGGWQKAWLGVVAFAKSNTIGDISMNYRREMKSANKELLAEARGHANKTSEYIVGTIKEAENELRQLNKANNFKGETGTKRNLAKSVQNNSRSNDADRKPAIKSKSTPDAPLKLELPTPEEPDMAALEAEAKDITRRYIQQIKEAMESSFERIELGELKQLIDLEGAYKNGEVSFEIYEERKKKIHDEALVYRYSAEEDAYEKIAELRDVDVEDMQDAERKKLEAKHKILEKQNEKRTQTTRENAGTTSGKNSSFKSLLDPFKKLDEEERKAISSQIAAYQELAQAAADAYNQILQVKIDALDKEISIREKRVEEAKKLAERGNTEALRLEEERLRKAQQQRENYARRQQAVNAAITVSNAIAAVARAALEGGGFGSVATIAALIAALAAGYAAVTSLSNDGGDAFAEGVIDYKGKGGPRDDKNWVRISTGESIITAEGTKKHRALLEAINTGARLQLSDASLPFVMPAFKSPGVAIQEQYASANDMQRLETKLDEVVVAIESNKLKQDIFFNEQGVGIMTERAIQRDRRRWK
jgi:hypothetical protein